VLVLGRLTIPAIVPLSGSWSTALASESDMPRIAEDIRDACAPNATLAVVIARTRTPSSVTTAFFIWPFFLRLAQPVTLDATLNDVKAMASVPRPNPR
jgi:hypothetical protein